MDLYVEVENIKVLNLNEALRLGNKKHKELMETLKAGDYVGREELSGNSLVIGKINSITPEGFEVSWIGNYMLNKITWYDGRD